MSFIRHCFLIMSRAFEKRPLMYFLIVISQVVSVLCIFFAFGLITHAYTSFENASEEERAFYMELNCRYDELMTKEEKATNAMPYDEFKKRFKGISDVLGDEIEEITVHSWMDFNGEYIVVSSYYYEERNYESYEIATNMDGYKVGDIIHIDGYDYKVALTKDVVVNFAVMNGEDTPTSARVIDILFKTKQPLTYDVYKEVKNKITLLFPEYIIDAPETPQLLDIQMGKTQITLSAVLIVIVVLNCSLCYMFLYESRKKTFAIYRICGAREEYCMLICITEVIVYMILSFAGAYLLFDNLIKNIVVDFYPKSALAYTLKNYLFLFGAYAVATMIIMTLCIISFISKPIVEERK